MLSQVRMRERHVRYTIAVLVVIFGLLGSIALMTPSGALGSTSRSIIIGVAVATTVPAAFAISRVHLGVIWWTKQSAIKGFNTAFVVYADIGLTVCLFTIADVALALYCAALFAVIGSYVAHFVRTRVAYAHMAFSSMVVCVLGVVAWSDGTPALDALFTTLALLVVTNGTTALHRSYTSDFQESLKHQLVMANTDALTGLLNRRGFIHATTLMVRNSPAGPLALLTADVDRFKSINDEHGHGTGDLVLQRVAQILQSAVDEQAVVARLGGDEFAIAIRHDETDACALAEHIRAQLIETSAGSTATISLGISIGTLPGHEVSDAEAMSSIRHDLAIADDALFDAKAAGRGTFVVARHDAGTTDGRL
ncbi:GGDEF domain-containing protein [Gordonia jinghuaiqii]|uniref:GGDEF domain-containing protein n=1 Tax=Gordonia jinghuaiqii TaxID=2758710 RepID=UPI001FCF8E08|nr:GGDEF domain-containing protein [Gordonia jinghuaiqii]